MEVGAHLVDLRGRNRSHYIVLLCHECNKTDDEFELKLGVRLVSANIKV